MPYQRVRQIVEEDSSGEEERRVRAVFDKCVGSLSSKSAICYIRPVRVPQGLRKSEVGGD